MHANLAIVEQVKIVADLEELDALPTAVGDRY